MAWPPGSRAGMFDLSRESGQRAQAGPDPARPAEGQTGQIRGSSTLNHKWQEYSTDCFSYYTLGFPRCEACALLAFLTPVHLSRARPFRRSSAAAPLMGI